MPETKGKTTIFTIGFTKKSAQEFFELLKVNKVKKVIDTRLNNESQLAGFSKKDDLRYFLKSLINVGYSHLSMLAPSDEILSGYKKKQMTWKEYEQRYIKLITDRQIESKLDPFEVDGSCFLCSEAEPHYCHRRLLAEYLQSKWGNVVIKHIVGGNHEADKSDYTG